MSEMAIARLEMLVDARESSLCALYRIPYKKKEPGDRKAVKGRVYITEETVFFAIKEAGGLVGQQ